MKLKSYRELAIWRRSVDFVVSVYRLTRTFPDVERFGLVSQLRRAAISIPANVAEGHGRTTRGEVSESAVSRSRLAQ
jgi:four helix bundle protein